MNNKLMMKLSAVGYLACIPFLSLSSIAVTIGMIFGVLLTLFITIECNKKMDK